MTSIILEIDFDFSISNIVITSCLGTPTVVRGAHFVEVQTKLGGRSGELLPHLLAHAGLVPMPGEEEAAVVGLDGDVAAPVDQHVVWRGLGDDHPVLYKFSSADCQLSL